MNTKTLFIASGSGEMDVTAVAMRACRDMGWGITCDWIAMRREEPPHMTDEEKLAVIDTLESGIVAASTLWLRLPANKSEGAAHEFGFIRGMLRVLAANRPAVVVSGPITDDRLYPMIAKRDHTYYAKHEDALMHLQVTMDVFKEYEWLFSGRCHTGRNGGCNLAQCPQQRDGEPSKSGRSCPLACWSDE